MNRAAVHRRIDLRCVRRPCFFTDHVKDEQLVIYRDDGIKFVYTNKEWENELHKYKRVIA